MSQLDFSISFSQLIGLLVFFYCFYYHIYFITIQYFYNNSYSKINENILVGNPFEIVDLTIVNSILSS